MDGPWSDFQDSTATDSASGAGPWADFEQSSAPPAQETASAAQSAPIQLPGFLQSMADPASVGEAGTADQVKAAQQAKSNSELVSAIPKMPAIPTLGEARSVAEGIPRGFLEGSIGLREALDPVWPIGDRDRQNLDDYLNNLRKADAGTGIMGSIGSGAGDPRTAALTAATLVAPEATVGPKMLAAGRGALGGIYGATDPLTKEEENQGDRYSNFVKDAALFAGLPIATKYAGDAAGWVGDNLKQAFAPGTVKATGALPDNIATSGLDILANASKGNSFRAAPNPLQSGLDANQAISKNYHVDSQISNALYKKGELLGDGKTTTSDGLENTLDDVISNIEADPFTAVNPDKQNALMALKKVQSNLGTADTYSGLVDQNGNPIAKTLPNTIGYSDLLNLNRALKTGFKSNEFSGEKGHILGKFANDVNDKIQSLANVDPDFVAAHNEANSFYRDKIAAIYRDNSSIDPFWQPEDYYAWRRAQPDANGNVNPNAVATVPGTLSRANNFLNNLNSNNAGGVASVAQAMNPSSAESVFRDALKQASTDNPTAANAVIQMLTGHPLNSVKALGSTLGKYINKSGEQPILTLAKNIKEQMAAPGATASENTGNILGRSAANLGSNGSAPIEAPSATIPANTTPPWQSAPASPVGPQSVGPQSLAQPQQPMGQDTIAGKAENDTLVAGTGGNDTLAGTINPISQQMGNDPAFMHRVAMVESSGNPNASSTTSSARGLYQFTTPMWRSMVDKYGAQYGVSYRDRMDPVAQTVMANALMNENKTSLTNTLGRTPNQTELYLAHFLGAPQASRMLQNMNNLQVTAAQLAPGAAQSNPSAFFENGRPVSPARLYAKMQSKIQGS